MAVGGGLTQLLNILSPVLVGSAYYCYRGKQCFFIWLYRQSMVMNKVSTAKTKLFSKEVLYMISRVRTGQLFEK